jgi:hypothetical protein
MPRKYIVGTVCQVFDDNGVCTSQEFIAGDQVDYHDDNFNYLEAIEGEVYQPMLMIQPDMEQVIKT